MGTVNHRRHDHVDLVFCQRVVKIIGDLTIFRSGAKAGVPEVSITALCRPGVPMNTVWVRLHAGRRVHRLSDPADNLLPAAPSQAHGASMSIILDWQRSE